MPPASAPGSACTKRCVESARCLQHPPGTFNPWSQRCALDLEADAPRARRERLLRHLSAPTPRFILLGEAAGWQGARYSGCAFTSERLLLEGAIPRMPDLAGRRLSRRPRPFSEPSATNVWGALYRHGIAEHTLLWNAFALHPHGPNDLSNRAPSRAEQAAALGLLQGFLALFEGVPVMAIGRVAERLLRQLGYDDVVYLRHPSYGGVPAFNQGLARQIARRR